VTAGAGRGVFLELARFMTPSPDYRPDIDGLRAVAVLPVLLFHAGFGLPGGFVGVDVFFVISGYLITGLILKDLDAGTFSLTQFWERRVRRIMPPLLVVLATSSVLAWYWLLPQEFQDFCGSVAAQAVMLSNMWFCLKTGYFQPTAEATPLLHLWSLAVEEQFYIVLPLALMVAARFRRSWILPGLVVATVLSFAACVFESYARPNINYYMIYSRAWELLVGSLVLYVPAAAASRIGLRNVVGFAGLLAIAAAVLFFDKETRFPGVAALLPCLGAAAVIWAGKPGRSSAEAELAPRPAAVARWLSWPLLRGIGLISYSLYLWHWPLLVFARMAHYREPTAVERAVILAVSVILAIASWYLVETPFRRRIVFPRRRGILAFGAAALAFMFTLCFQGARSDGYPQRFSEASLRYNEGARDFPLFYPVSIDAVRSDRLFELGGGSPADPVHCLLWGDSHAGSIAPALQALAEAHHKRCVAATYPGTAPLLGFASRSIYSLLDECPKFNQEVLEYVRRHRVPHVVLACFWSSHVEGLAPHLRERPEMPEYFARTVKALQEAGATVWIMKQVPVYTLSVPQKLARLSAAGETAAGAGAAGAQIGVGAFEDFERDLVAYGAAIDSTASLGAKVLEPRRYLSDAQGRSLAHDHGRSLYYDSNHLTATGALYLRPLFEPIFAGVPERAAERSEEPAVPVSGG